MTYIDLAHDQDGDKMFDLVIENGDFKTTEGLETALLTSLFSDRRAYADEVNDPLKRRGWIGDLVSQIPGDKFGSGIWFYEQSRLTQTVENGVRSEADLALQWLLSEQLATFVNAETDIERATRTLKINITITSLNGGVSSRAFEIADATRRGAFIR